MLSSRGLQVLIVRLRLSAQSGLKDFRAVVRPGLFVAKRCRCTPLIFGEAAIAEFALRCCREPGEVTA